MSPELLQHARDEYYRLLLLPLASIERHHNQSYMAFLRDVIADAQGLSSEAVQATYEAMTAPMAQAWSAVHQRAVEDQQQRFDAKDTGY